MRPSLSFVSQTLLAIALAFLAAAPHADAAVWRQGAVAADHPIASQIGADVLARGGHAVDAAVATAFALGVLNNFASGIGGGGFALIHDGDGEQVYALDFRENAPAALTPEHFSPNGQHDPQLSIIGGLAVGVPGEVAGLWAMHQRFGRIPWNELVAPAIQLAAQGFEAHDLFITRVEAMHGRTAGDNTAERRLQQLFDRTYVFEGELQPGTIVRRPGLAAALEIIARQGAPGFYEGEIADDILQSIEKAGGVMTAEDLRAYQPVWREPLFTTFRGYRIASFPPPSSAGIIFPIALHAYEELERRAGFEENLFPLRDAASTHRFLHALTWAFAVRANLLGDPAYIPIDLDWLTGPAFRERIVNSFVENHRLPPEAFSVAPAPPEDHGTSHFSVVDRWGNSVALTTTVNTLFGSQVAGSRFGIVLNNQLNDFAIAPTAANAFGLVGSEHNAVRPGARPLSSMAPTLIFRDNALVGSLGGSGGPRIITGTILTMMALMTDATSTREAILTPRIHHQWQPAQIELADALRDTLGVELEAYGYEILPMRWSSAVQGIWRRRDGWDAASDSAKLGAPAGTNYGSRENVDRAAAQPRENTDALPAHTR